MWQISILYPLALALAATPDSVRLLPAASVEHAVGQVDDRPLVIGVIPDATISEERTSSLPYEIQSRDTPLPRLAPTAISSNPSVIPDSEILHAGWGTQRALILSPSSPGHTDITVTLSDGRATARRTFGLTVTPRASQSRMLLSAVISERPKPAIRLVFPTDPAARGYRVFRKPLVADSWGAALASLPGDATGFTDTNVSLGTAFEYRLVKNTSESAFLHAGIRASLIEDRGTIILVVDQTHAAGLRNELARLRLDLVGDGWEVLHREVSRNDNPAVVKALLQSEFRRNPSQVKAVFMFGHVPIPHSGWYSPDGHHERAMPADVFYADMDGAWTDVLNGNLQPLRPETRNYPGDGRYDPSNLPSDVELEVGRVDLFNLPAFLPRTERDLLRQYLDKNHKFRHGMLNVQRRGLADGWTGHSLLNPAALFGPSRVFSRPFFRTLETDGYLWVSRAQYGNYRGFNDGGGSTADFAARDPQAVFLQFAGSYFGEWDIWDNFLRAALGSPTHTLASMYQMPAWFCHPMALGQTVGYAAKLTQNNPRHDGLYSMNDGNARRVHIALMGDPTLRLHPVKPPRQLVPSVRDRTVRLEWQESPDVVEGYHVYRSANVHGPFARRTDSLLRDVQFLDPDVPDGAWTYMVRAVKLEVSASGTYLNPSQGVMRLITVRTPADTNAPAARITSPLRDAVVFGLVTVSAEATDDWSIARVVLSVDGQSVGTATEAPFSFRWDTSHWAAGPHVLAVTAVGLAGNQAGDAVRVVVAESDSQAPVLSLKEPADGQKVWGNVIVRAAVEDNAGAARVELWMDDARISTRDVPPYDFLWKTYDAATGNPAVADGPHRISVRAHDLSGNAAERTANVTVDSALGHPTVLRNTPAELVAQPGHVVDLTYNWQGGPASREWMVFTHLVDEAGRTIPVDSHFPPLPAHYWSGLYSYPVKFRVKRSLRPGLYKIMTGLYTGDRRLALRPGAGVTADDQLRYQSGVLTVVPDTTPPELIYLTELKGQRLVGKVPVSLRVVDNVRIVRVEVLVDGRLDGQVPVVPNLAGQDLDRIDNLFWSGSYEWNTTAYTNGSHRLTLRAIDSSGNQGDHHSDVSVKNPTVWLAEPSDLAARAGEPIALAYHWSGGPTDVPTRVTTELIGETAQRVAFRHLHTPAPSSECWTNDHVRYTNTFSLPRDLAPGRYQISVRVTNLGGRDSGQPVDLAPGPGVRPIGIPALGRHQIGTLTISPPGP